MTGYILQSWLLAPLYLVGVAVVFAVALAAGGISPHIGRGSYMLFCRTSIGLALISFAAAAMGLIGAFYSWIIFPLLGLLAVVGITLRPMKGDLVLASRDLKHGFTRYRKLRPAGRLMALAIAIVAGLLCLNALLGGLSPPMGHDAMWYHLAVPRQWTFSHRFEAYPDVMPSNYPLAGNALYAVLLLGGAKAAFCNAFYAACGVLLLITTVSASMVLTSRLGRPTHAVAAGVITVAIWVPLVARECLIAPAMAQNDIFAMLWALVGITELWRARQFSWKHAAAAGFLLGTAAAAKLVVVLAVATAPAIPLVLAFSESRKLTRHAWVAALAVVGGIALGYLPWGIRGLLTNGLPFFPLTAGVFSPTPDFELTLHTSRAWNGLLAPGRTGLTGALENLAYKLHAAGTSGVAGFYLFVTAGVLCLALTRGPRRAYALFLCLFTAAIFLMQGGLEVLRYFSLYFPLAAPVVAWVILDLLRRTQRPLLPVALVLAAFGYGAYGVRQANQASAPIFDYSYRPVLAAADLSRRATVAELGTYYQGAMAFQSLIPDDARLFLPDNEFPFYISRHSLWNDLATRGGIADRWAAMPATEAETFLKARQIDAILYCKLPSDAPAPTQLARLLASGSWVEPPAPPDAPTGWRLFRLNPAR